MASQVTFDEWFATECKGLSFEARRLMQISWNAAPEGRLQSFDRSRKPASRRDSMSIRTTTELLEVAAEALSNGDELTLDELKSTVHDWLQPEAERNAQLAMLDAMLDAIGQFD